MEAKMSMQAKKELVHRMRWQYLEANRKGKTEIIDAVIAATGYHRKYVVSVLRQSPARLKAVRKPLRTYDEEMKAALVMIWKAANYICSKRLAPFLPEFVEILERFGHLNISSEVKAKLFAVSPATIDRLLAEERKQHPRGRATTRPGNLLKQQIKIRTFAEWNDVEPGFFEADLVAHCGDHVDGSFLNTLVLIDIATCWIECAPLLRKSDADVTAALNAIRAVLPITLLGLDTDNGCEFINYELFEYCEREKITFTRSRPYKKNDQCHVEQKNGSVVRRTVGYDRFEGVDAWNRLMNLYRVLRLYINFFQPSCKLVKKERIGSRVRKIYDKARTPYQRVLDAPQVSADSKRKLTDLYGALDPVALFDQIGHLQTLLLEAATDYTPLEQPVEVSVPSVVAQPEHHYIAEPSSLKPVQTGKRAYQRTAARTVRTRKDPLDGANDFARQLFDKDRCITGAELLKRLQEEYPDRFTGRELKTVQRRLAIWRREHVAKQHETQPYGTAFDTSACRQILAESNPLAPSLVTV
jgi:hypothetical protein